MNEYEVNNEGALAASGEEVSGEANALEQTVKKVGALLSPEGIIMLPLAILLDIAGIIFTILDIAYGIGEIPSWISDGIGIIFFGLWILIRHQTMARPKELAKEVAERRKAIKGAVKQAKKMGKGLRFAISTIGEILPLVGALPFWTWMVWAELRGED
ncbi:hypothetical protein MUP06_01085 [Patescibacteria group bacterium]|nr:hypothetical protein [Patescibacteria group bacterium]